LKIRARLKVPPIIRRFLGFSSKIQEICSRGGNKQQNGEKRQTTNLQVEAVHELPEMFPWFEGGRRSVSWTVRMLGDYPRLTFRSSAHIARADLFVSYFLSIILSPRVSVYIPTHHRACRRTSPENLRRVFVWNAREERKYVCIRMMKEVSFFGNQRLSLASNSL
jgi:hypothetical protein